MRKFHLSLIAFVALITGLLIATGSSANVSLRNGNFFTAYTDIVYPGGFEPKVERVYNSKSPFYGMFGWGWGSELDVYLKVSPDGSVVVHEYGGGAENRFTPRTFDEGELNKAVELISGAARKAGIVASAEQLNQYKNRLKTDSDFRNGEWTKFEKQIPARKLAPNTQLYSNRFSYQYITKTNEGYVRSYESGKVERFNELGRLVKMSDKNGNFIQLFYATSSKDPKVQKLTDNLGRSMYFTFNNQGLLERIEGEGKKKAEYKYNNLSQLIYSKDTDGNVYTFKYDKRHNLLEIGYSDKTTMQMTYYGQDKFENIKTVKDRDGTLTEYSFQNDPSDRGHAIVGVKIKGSDGKPISDSRYEYFFKYKKDGEEWTQRMISSIDGDTTETIYDERFGLPLQIKRNGEETLFEYDAKGHVTKKVTPTEVTKLEYDLKVNKVSKVTRFPKGNEKGALSSSFVYDDRGNLKEAKNSEGAFVLLTYDRNGQISSMIDKNSKRTILFKYDDRTKKPIEISDPAMGTITVTYTNTGEIKEVKSSAGRKIALQVTATFQKLLDIIRPAGVNLSF